MAGAKLADTTVSAGDQKLPLLYVSATQINALIPLGTTGRKVTSGDTETEVLDIKVTRAGTSSPVSAVPLGAYAPALFTRDMTGTGPASFTTKAFAVRDEIAPGEPIILYATGLGPVDGDGICQNVPKVQIGGAAVPVKSTRMSIVNGVYLVELTTPATLETDLVEVLEPGELAHVGEHQLARLPFTPSPTVTDIKDLAASVEIAYPASGSKTSYSPVTVVGTLQLSFTVPSGAKAFSVVVDVQNRGSSQEAIRINVDPAAKTGKAIFASPTPAERWGDFSRSSWIPFDFTTGRPFPGQIVNQSRLYLAAVRALQTVPSPNTSSSTYEVPLTVTPGKKLQLQAPASFGTFIDIPAGSASGTVSYAKAVIYVDGRQVASEPFSITVE